ncbi:CsgG/HfaB family protein [Lewinella sp. IMCC34183]|uniref:CsgG/HfaB family protein n=1 Tax=Lewinella sp. IMCC34183 TaxID=2248762 RepID=UPI000E22752E|nr:CsgG/HfaB family protein [Lewinella sp. IMCC34183]
MNYTTLLLTLFFCSLAPGLLAQKAEEEIVIASCDLPRDEKNIVAVSRFDYHASDANSSGIGNGMADMLTNALLNSGCYRVVDRQTIEDILAEQDFATTGRVDPGTASSIGSLTGAQLIVTGKVTEFKENAGGGALGALVGGRIGGAGLVKAHVGFIIQIIETSTGEILVSKSIDKKKNKIGVVSGAGGRGIGVGAGFFSSQAMADATEEAIIEAVAILAEERESLPPPTFVEGSSSTILIEGLGYSDLRTVASSVEDFPDVLGVSKRVEDGNGVLEIRHTCSLEDVLDRLLDSAGGSMDVADMSDNYVRLVMQ